MYNLQSTLNDQSDVLSVLTGSKGITFLDVNVDGFYSIFHSTEPNNAMEIALIKHKVPGLGYIDPRGLKQLCVSVIKASVIFMYADNRGLYLEYWSGEQYRKNCFTLHIQWKELGIEDPTESHFVNFHYHLKKGIMERSFSYVLSKGSKARKAILKVLDSISITIGETYKICNNYSIHNSEEGSWDLYKDNKKIKTGMVLEQITLALVRDQERLH